MTSKVILLIGTLSNGGAERVVSNISINLAEKIEREIILFGKDAKIDYPYKGKITYLDQGISINLLTKIITFIRRVKNLKKIKRDNPNVPVISFMEYPNLLNMLCGTPKNSIVSVRNFMSTKHKKGLKAFFWNLTIKHLYKKAQKIVVVSKQMKNDLIVNYSLPEEKIKVIYNSYPIKEIQKLANQNLTKSDKDIFDKPTVITIGRLNKQKGQHHLLNSFRKVKDVLPNAQLVFLGEGRLKEQLIIHSKKLDVYDSVHFLGFQQNPFKYIARSKVFVLTSYFEGFPNALAEAMACKIPVISTDCPSGPREILAPSSISKTIDYYNTNNECGILLPNITSENKEEVEDLIAQSITKVLNDKRVHQRFACKSHERIKDFDIVKIINDWEQVIQCKYQTFMQGGR